MAELVLRDAFEVAGLGDEVVVDSAGVSAEEVGNRLDRRAAAALRRHGVPDTGFAAHRARRFQPDWFDEVDLVLAAEESHADRLRRAAPDATARDKVRLLRSFDPVAVADGTLHMDDPWYGGDSAFDETFAEIAGAAPGVVAYVRGELGR